jgi:hypothetical protein
MLVLLHVFNAHERAVISQIFEECEVHYKTEYTDDMNSEMGKSFSSVTPKKHRSTIHS